MERNEKKGRRKRKYKRKEDANGLNGMQTWNGYTGPRVYGAVNLEEKIEKDFTSTFINVCRDINPSFLSQI